MNAGFDHIWRRASTLGRGLHQYGRASTPTKNNKGKSPGHDPQPKREEKGAQSGRIHKGDFTPLTIGRGRISWRQPDRLASSKINSTRRRSHQVLWLAQSARPYFWRVLDLEIQDQKVDLGKALRNLCGWGRKARTGETWCTTEVEGEANPLLATIGIRAQHILKEMTHCQKITR